MQTTIAAWLLLLVGFALNSVSTFTAAFSRRWGARAGQRISLVLRVGLGMPLWILGVVLAVRVPGPRLFPAHPVLDVLGWLLISCGAAVILWAAPGVGRRALMPSTADTLVAAGPYAYVRHPIYSGGLLEFTGLAVVHPTTSFALACAAGCVWLLAQARLEERDLLQRMPDYADYMRRLPRFVPRRSPGSRSPLSGVGVNRKLVSLFALRETIATATLAVILFWSTGHVDWWPGWAFIGLTLGWAFATLVVILHFHPGLLADRLGPRKGAKRWDTAIMGLVGLATLARLVVAGLDQRHAWSRGISPGAQVAALIVGILAYALVVWATAANAYFSYVVRIQEERGHAVATGGPYRWIRHPAYAGAILLEGALPFLLGSWWALIPGGLIALLFVARTALEDRTLMRELPGYSDYAAVTRYRLLPGLW